MRRLTLAFLLAVASPSLADEPTVAAADIEYFEKKIRPLLAEHCYRCHSSKAERVRGGLLLDSAASLQKGGDSGPAVRRDKPGDSLLLRAVAYHDESLQMPPRGKLPDKDIALLKEWVSRGAPFPAAQSPASNMKRSGVNVAEGRKFWSFQPVRERTPPIVRNRTWARRPTDLFLLAELEKHGLTPSAPADRRTQIRRAYFDLLGLPPAPAEVEAFVQNEAPEAYAQLIDRLLSSPHYGERWGRYWLDLARYCDQPEPWSDCKGQAHIYRDWVVRAFNEDMPYDQFVLKQLAADLMPDAKLADRAALGLLGLSPSYWKELKLDPAVIKGVAAEEWEERIHTVTSTFLGLTVACARCHDHKFDPITTEDYYGLAGVFASIKLADRSLLADDLAGRVQAARIQVAELEKQLAKLKQAKDASPAETTKVQAKIEQIKKDTPGYDVPLAPGVEEASLHVLPDGAFRTRLVYKAGEAQDMAVQIRGNPTNLGPVVTRRFLTVLSSHTTTPAPFTKGSGRLELAQAIVDDAAPLAARVIVNRVWMHHFGAGLVRTPSNFGVQGERPSHPELLEDLAARFIANGWSIKWLHREIMLSAAYQQASTTDPKKHAVDPDNRWLWRMNRRRLDVEAWRDAMLAVSGTLDPRSGGASQDLGDAANKRRTIYGTVKRRELSDLLRLHDFPDPTTHSAERLPTTTPLQQLFTLNSPFMQQQAAALVKRLRNEAPSDDKARVQLAYRLLFGRAVSETQMQLALDFVTAGSAGDAGWEEYAQVLLGSNEFLFID